MDVPGEVGVSISCKWKLVQEFFRLLKVLERLEVIGANIRYTKYTCTVSMMHQHLFDLTLLLFYGTLPSILTQYATVRSLRSFVDPGAPYAC